MRIVIVLAATLLASCLSIQGVIFNKFPDDHGCSEEFVYPIGDSVAVAVFGGLALYDVVHPNTCTAPAGARCSYGALESTLDSAAAMATVAIASAASAVLGYYKCRGAPAASPHASHHDEAVALTDQAAAAAAAGDCSAVDKLEPKIADLDRDVHDGMFETDATIKRCLGPAWALTRSAAASARAGDCTAAIDADAKVAALDADFHDTVFARDAAIARCLPAP